MSTSVCLKQLGPVDLFNGIDIEQTKYYIKLNCKTYIEHICERHLAAWMKDGRLQIALKDNGILDIMILRPPLAAALVLRSDALPTPLARTCKGSLCWREIAASPCRCAGD